MNGTKRRVVFGQNSLTLEELENFVQKMRGLVDNNDISDVVLFVTPEDAKIEYEWTDCALLKQVELAELKRLQEKYSAK